MTAESSSAARTGATRIGAARVVRKDPVLAGVPLLVGFAFMMGIVMTVVFPSGREYAALTNKQGADAYSIAYLTVLTRAEPNDTLLRHIYVGQLAQLGRWDEALDVLDHAPAAARESLEARSQRLELMLAKARTRPEGTPERALAFSGVHVDLARFADNVPPGRARELAQLALELEDPMLAARFYLAAASAAATPADRATALADAGRWFRAAGDGPRAADSYQRAANESPDAAQKTPYLIEAAAALEATTGACAAAAVLATPAATSDDIVLVRRATETVRRCARAPLAKVLGRRLLALSNGDETETKAQVRRELEAGDSAGALALLRHLVVLHPGDARLRETTARVAEWAGQPQVALQQWLWLLESGRTPTGKIELP